MQQNMGRQFQIIQDKSDARLCGYDYYQMLFWIIENLLFISV